MSRIYLPHERQNIPPWAFPSTMKSMSKKPQTSTNFRISHLISSGWKFSTSKKEISKPSSLIGQDGIGVEDGADIGAIVGDIDGAGDGERVGAADGEDDGDSDGSADGLAVGS